MTASKRAWVSYPAAYRQDTIAILAHWVQAGESGALVGLAGAGKSNLLGFLCHRPDRLTSHLDGPTAVIQVDLNTLPGADLATFFRLLLRSLYESGPQLAQLDPELPGAIEARYRKVEDKTDPFFCQSALREALFLFAEKDIRLVLVLDPFDQFCRAAPTAVLDNLRGLRDSFKAALSFIVGLRTEVAYLRHPLELGELYEILDSHQCWLGPMSTADAGWVLDQALVTAATPLTNDQRRQLIQLTGGYPSLLRAAGMWWMKQGSSVKENDWEELLVTQSAIRNRLQEVWDGLTGEEQAALAILQTALALSKSKERRESLRQIEETHQQALTTLQAKQLCTNLEQDGRRFFSPLLERFVAGQAGINAGRIRYDDQVDIFYRGSIPLTGLTDKDRQLLRYFVDHPYHTHHHDTLISAAWADDDSDGVTTQALQQAIRHLRKEIELNPAKPRYLITQPRAGYRFFPEGAPYN